MGKALKTKTIDWPLPIKGIHAGVPRHAIPEGYSPDCNNVTAFDLGGRDRIGTRPGLSKYFAFRFGGTAASGAAVSCQLMHQCAIELSGTRTDYIITAFGGKVYRQVAGSGSKVRIDGIDDADAATFSAGRRVEAATLYGITYFTDGLVLKQYNHLTTTWASYTASAGSMPVTATPRYCRLFAAWRGRLVQALLDDASPELWFMSAQGNPRDFDYGATPNAAMAVAANVNFRAGQIGQPITALIPINEDRLLFGLDHGIYQMLGDGADGGTLMPITEQIGILTQDAWCLVGDTLFFMAPDGLYKWNVGQGEPTSISKDVYGNTYSGFPRVGYYVNVKYHASRNEVWIMLTHNVTTYTTLHAIYDVRTGGLFPQSFIVDTGGDDGAGSGGTGAPKIGPTKMLYYDGGSSFTFDSVMLLGCRDGYIRKVDASSQSDDGSAITSYVWMAPMCLSGQSSRMMINGWYFTAGEQSNYNATWLLQSADTAYNAMANPVDSKTGTFTTNGEQSPLGSRLKGSTFALKFSNSTDAKGYDLERITLRLLPAGMVR